MKNSSENPNFLQTLNNKQLEAVTQGNVNCMVFSGAGSGKTRVLIHRIAYLLHQGISPYNILAVTFTNKAAKEIKNRLRSLVPTHSNDVWTGTFHSICLKILKIEVEYSGMERGWQILDQNGQISLIKKIIKSMTTKQDYKDSKGIASSIAKFISTQKVNLIGPDEAKEPRMIQIVSYTEVYKEYQKRLVIQNMIDFDDMISLTVNMFNRFPEVADRWQKRFKYLLVDEYQDINNSQKELTCLLGKQADSVFVLGDENQCIYGWRGSEIRHILHFENDFQNSKTIKMEQNYRSTSNIIEAANALISNNANSMDKKLWTSAPSGSLINCHSASSPHTAGAFVARKIKELISRGIAPSDIAILYRMNYQSLSLEIQLMRSKIPYQVLSSTSFFDRMEIKDHLAYVQLAANLNNDDAFDRAIAAPKRGIGPKALDNIHNFASANSISSYNACKNHIDELTLTKKVKESVLDFIDILEKMVEISKTNDLSSALRAVDRMTNYFQHFSKEESEERSKNVDELMLYSSSFNSIEDFLDSLALMSDSDVEEKSDKVKLLTVHASKGLEFKNVFIFGLIEGAFPSAQAVLHEDNLLKENPLASSHLIEEERRLMYVAITRAEENLTLVTYSNGHQKQFVHPSRFFLEIPSRFKVKVF